MNLLNVAIKSLDSHSYDATSAATIRAGNNLKKMAARVGEI